MVVKLDLEVLSLGPSWERLQNWKLRQSIGALSSIAERWHGQGKPDSYLHVLLTERHTTLQSGLHRVWWACKLGGGTALPSRPSLKAAA